MKDRIRKVLVIIAAAALLYGFIHMFSRCDSPFQYRKERGITIDTKDKRK